LRRSPWESVRRVIAGGGKASPKSWQPKGAPKGAGGRKPKRGPRLERDNGAVSFFASEPSLRSSESAAPTLVGWGGHHSGGQAGQAGGRHDDGGGAEEEEEEEEVLYDPRADRRRSASSQGVQPVAHPGNPPGQRMGRGKSGGSGRQMERALVEPFGTSRRRAWPSGGGRDGGGGPSWRGAGPATARAAGSDPDFDFESSGPDSDFDAGDTGSESAASLEATFYAPEDTDVESLAAPPRVPPRDAEAGLKSSLHTGLKRGGGGRASTGRHP